MTIPAFDPLTAFLVVLATAITDAIYIRFTAAIINRQRLATANWSSLWYLMSSFAVINYTHNWIYVVFAAAGSWIGAYVSMPGSRPPQNRRASDQNSDDFSE